MLLFLFVVFYCVVCFHSRHLICTMLCLCCLVFSLSKNTRTKWFCCLRILWSSFLFCCFVLKFVFFGVFHFSPKKTKNRTQQKPNKNAEKKGQEKSVSAVVFTNRVPNILGVGLKVQIFAEHTLKRVVSAYFEKLKRANNCQKDWIKTWSKVASKLGPSMLLRNIIGPSAQHNWTKFWLKKG